MTIKVFIYQRPDTIQPDSGIGRVVHAQYKYLPMYGIELTNDYKRADVITSHTDIFDLPRVDLVYCHGLYWNGDPDSGQYNNSHHETNRKIISAIRKSLAVTVPSDWVGECFRRDMRLSPFVIPHGIDLEQWRPGGMGDYILWGKNRGGDVCDATPAWELANRGYEVVSTFSPANYPVPSRMAVTGRIPETEMRDLLMGAYIYLATTKETFGIQTLEAMACFPAETNVKVFGVQRAMQKLYSGPLITIKTARATIRATGDHPFYTNEGWVLAKSLTVGHRLLYNPLYGRTQEVHTGTIKAVIERLQDNDGEGRWQTSWNQWQGSGISTAYPNGERVCYPQTISRYRPHETTDSESRADSLYRWLDRWGGNSIYQASFKEDEASHRNIQHISTLDEVANQNDRYVRGRVGRSKESRRTQRNPLCLPYHGANLSRLLQGIDSLSRYQEREHEVDSGVGRITPQTIEGRPILETPSRDIREDSHAQYEAIEETCAEFVRDLPVYNFTTKTGTYLAEGYLVHNCGAPVLGFDWGGTRDIVTHKVDGYLVPPYDYKALEEGAEYIHQHRQEMSQAARHKASQYTWDKAMKMYANAFQSVQGMLTWEKQNSGVAVVITSYNYAHYLGEALWSISNQSLKPSEVIVVDDASTDDTTVVAEDYRQRFEVEGVRYKVITHQSNCGVATARNRGVESAVSPFIVCLDADDRLHPLYLKACRDAFLKDRGLGIVYSGLGIIQPDGKVYENVWTGKFDWEFQADVGVPPHTTIPTAAMFRKEMWKRAGGYRQRYAPGEDAEFYTRGLSLGFTAQKVTDSPLIEYRIHGQGAHQTRRYIRIDDDKPWMRDHLYPLGAPSSRAPLVRSYSSPLVAVHINMLPDEKGVKWVDETGLFATLESLVGQSWREWEVVITEPIKMTTHAQYPFIHLKHTAPLCIMVKAGTVLPNDFLITELTRYVSLSENQEWDGGESMGRCCGGAIDPKQMAQLQMLKQGNMKPLDPSGRNDVSQTVTTEGQLIMRGDFVRMEYIGDKTGATTIFGKAGSNRQYRAGNNPTEKYIDVHKEDVEKLQNTGDFRLVRINREVRVETKTEPEPTPQVSAPVDLAAYAPLRDSRIPFGERRVGVESTPLVGVEGRVEESKPESIPERFRAREIPPEALGDLAGDTPIAPVEPTPEPPPLPPSPMVSDTSWPTQENETVLKQRAMRRDIKLGP